MPLKTLTLHLVRHGETYYNRYNKLQGWSNSPLTERGLAQAIEIGTRLTYTRYAAAYSSDTTRAEQTASIILSHNAAGAPSQPIIDRDLRETFFGSFEGTNAAAAWFQAGGPHHCNTLTDIIAAHSLATARNWLKDADPFHDAEDDDEYWHRIHRGYGRILANPTLADGDTVLVVSHATTLRSFAERYGAGRFGAAATPRNGGLTTLRVSAEVPETAVAKPVAPSLDVIPTSQASAAKPGDANRAVAIHAERRMDAHGPATERLVESLRFQLVDYDR